MKENGKFVISLDFELMWGVRDKKSIQEYGESIRNVHQVIPSLLNLFEKYKVRATFSTVGFLFFENKKELLDNIPSIHPKYLNQNLSPYNGYFESIKDNYTEDLYHYAPLLIKQIIENEMHEIGSHTFSHYYCLEKGQSLNEFEADIKTAIKTAQLKNNIKIESLVFPRNQFNQEYLNICKENEILSYRGNEASWMYKAKNGEEENLIRRAFRLIDTYINLSGHNCYSDTLISSTYPMNIPASRFLRPYSKRLKFLERMRLRRILKDMTYAAKNNLTYHLWWHPHNFGLNQKENFTFLEDILKHYKNLNTKYKFESHTMTSLAKQLQNG